MTDREWDPERIEQLEGTLGRLRTAWLNLRVMVVVDMPLSEGLQRLASAESPLTKEDYDLLMAMSPAPEPPEGYIGELLESLKDMVNQFAYESVCYLGTEREGACIYTGGLSALEGAFDTLGYPDPMMTPDRECQADNCHQIATTGTPTRDGYKRLCGEHYRREKQP